MLVAAGSFLVACSGGEITAPRNVAGLAGSAASKPNCEHVSGAFVFAVFQFTSPTTAVGEGVVQGDLSGEFRAQYFGLQQRGKGVIALQASHTITRTDGTITTSDEILLLPDQNPAVARPNSRLDLVSGTGAYEGVTGLLHTHGELNLATTPPGGSIQYKGQVCA